MINRILCTLVLFALLTFIPQKIYAANSKITINYIEKYQEVFAIEKEIIENLTFTESSHFPFARTLYGSAKSITLSDNFKEKWIFTIHPFKITPYVMETISKMLRLAQIPTLPVYAHTLEINGKKYIGSLEKEYSPQFLKTIDNMLRDEAKLILSQEPISYLFEAQFKTFYNQDKNLIMHPANKIYYYLKDSSLSNDDFEDIFQYDKNIFEPNALNQLQTKNHTYWTQGINPDNQGTADTFFKIPFLRGYSREYCNRIHKYCMKNKVSSYPPEAQKVVSLFDSMPKDIFADFLDIEEINKTKIYNDYKNSIINRKNKITKYFKNMHKSLMPEKTYRDIEFTNGELSVYTDILNEEIKQLKIKLKKAKAQKTTQTVITSDIYPEAWLIVYNISIKAIDKNVAYRTMLKLIEKSKNELQKKTALIYLKSVPKPKNTVEINTPIKEKQA